MAQTRSILKVFKSKPTIEGAGVHLKRAFGFSEVPVFDPFLLLDDFRSNDPKFYTKGFPWHPHRGIETITYVLRGKVAHADSMGNGGAINPGDVQWMTAGSGIIHQEMPAGDSDGRMWGFQLWANLPASHKMMPPRYRNVDAATIPEVKLDNSVSIKIICGAVNGAAGPVRDIIIDPEYLDITVPAGTEFMHETKKGHSAFAYVIDGKGYFCRDKKPFAHDAESDKFHDAGRQPFAANENLVLFGDGDHILALTDDSSMRFLFVSGKPLKEPVAWYGPIVMNTRQELADSFEEYENGTFIKK